MARWTVGGLVLILLVGLLATTSAQTSSARQEAVRIGWLNLQAILQQTPGYAQAESTFSAEMEGYQADLQRLQQEFDSTLSWYEQQAIVLSPSAKQTKEAEIRDLQERLQTRAGELQNRAQERERQLVAPIEDRVKGVIEGVRAERNLGLIFDASAAGSNIIAADRTLDLTATILQRLRSNP